MQGIVWAPDHAYHHAVCLAGTSLAIGKTRAGVTLHAVLTKQNGLEKIILRGEKDAAYAYLHQVLGNEVIYLQG